MTAHWDGHPAVTTGPDLTVGDRAADRLRNGMGSWWFIFTALGFLAGWMVTNGAGMDPAPWIGLNLILSCLAALQGGILLIAAKRADRIAGELAAHDFTVNQEALALVRALHDTQHGGACRCWTTDGGS